ncbi:MAG: FG-GAP-like repeat-containing protein, partial [Phycisphaerales bacterium]|nr:FG-GAP-like repeat-containing protein [Phycisphaerales bacterium]
MDGDGDADVLSVSAYPADVVSWYENDGAVDPVFTERLITADAFFVGAIDVADVDGDGDADVLLPSAGDSTLAWYENDGATVPTFTQNVIVAEAVDHASWTDIDGDGDLDVLAVYTFVDSGSSFKKNVWFEHDGAVDPSFTERFISSVPVAIPVQAPVAASSADMDGDGDMDLLSVGTYTIAWDEQGLVENLDTGAVFDHLDEAIAVASPGDTLLTGSAALCGQCQTNLNFQGKAIEIIAAGAINRGVQTTTTLAVGATLSATSGSGVGVRGLLNVPAGVTGTIIGDGVTIGGPVSIGASGSIVVGPSVVFEGSVEFSDGVVIGSHPRPRTVIAADLDADGDIDVLSANSDDDTVVWYENDGAPDPVLTEHVVTAAADSAFSVAVSDVDGDGDLDVLSASTRDDKIAWHENDGASPPSFTEHIVT